jgi:hypothetical protein
MTKKCKDCGETKTSEYSHMAKSGAKVYKDEKGRLWKAACCPPCQAKQRAATRARLAEKIANGENPHTGSDFITIYVEDKD